MKKASLAALIIFLVGAFTALIIIDDVDISLSEDMVQTVIDKKIGLGPISSRGVSFDINKAVIDFRAIDNSAMIDIDFAAKGYGFAGKMTGQVASGIDYREPVIYLSNLRPHNIQTVLDDQSAAKLDEYKNIAKDFLAQKRKKMLSDKAKDSLDNVVKRESDQVKTLAAAYLQKYFETLPVYNLNEAGVKGRLASFALKDVRFTDSHAIITLSPLQAVLKILGMVFTFMLICLYVLYLFGGGLVVETWFKPRVKSDKDTQTQAD